MSDSLGVGGLLWGEGKRKALRARSLCAAISTIEYQFAYAVERMTEATFDVNADEKTGFFSYRLKDLPKKDEGVYLTLGRALLVGFEMVSNRHPKDVKLNVTT